PLLRTPFNEGHARVSPDGRFVAYTSDETGAFEVFVQSFPALGNKRRISTDGGIGPRWRGDGHELFYLSRDSRMMAVPVTGGATLEFGAPVVLFTTRLAPVRAMGGARGWDYDVSRDGHQFLIATPTADATTNLVVTLNWTA